jgi:VanZ family protein
VCFVNLVCYFFWNLNLLQRSNKLHDLVQTADCRLHFYLKKHSHQSFQPPIDPVSLSALLAPSLVSSSFCSQVQHALHYSFLTAMVLCILCILCILRIHSFPHAKGDDAQYRATLLCYYMLLMLLYCTREECTIHRIAKDRMLRTFGSRPAWSVLYLPDGFLLLPSCTTPRYNSFPLRHDHVGNCYWLAASLLSKVGLFFPPTNLQELPVVGSGRDCTHAR